MARITGLTAARMIAIEAASIIDGVVSGGRLILERFDGGTIDAGNVTGPTGNTGDKGVAMYAVLADLANISGVTGSAIGDFFVNTDSVRHTILGIATDPGGIIQSTSATAGRVTGNLLGLAAVRDLIVGGRVIALGNLTGAVNMSTVGSSALTASTSINAVVTATFTGNVTLSNLTMPAVAAGTQFAMIITQDGTGSRTLTLSRIRKPGGRLTLTTTAAAVDVVIFFYDGTNWYATLAGTAYAI